MQSDQPVPLRLGGALLAVGAVGFIVVFTLLASRFGYPDVLDRPPSEVLPALLAGGAGLRAIWAVYAALPIVIVAVALLTEGHLGLTGAAARVVTAAGIAAGVSMAVGLVRWSTVQWSLAESHAVADPAARAAIEAVSGALNVALGRMVGEFVGEIALAIWFVGVGWGLRRRWVGRASLALAALLALGSVRNVLPVANAATEVTNILLPVVMIGVGLTWALGLTWKVASSSRALPAAALALVLAFAPAAQAELPERELIVNGFRAPSTGLELRDGWMGFHLGFYPTILDEGADGAPRTTWFLKVGVLAYPLRFDAGSGRPSSPYVGVSLVQGLGNAWDVTRDASSGSGVLVETGFRWAAYKGLDLRLGGAVLAGFDGRVQVNPTPGIGWAVAY